MTEKPFTISDQKSCRLTGTDEIEFRISESRSPVSISRSEVSGSEDEAETNNRCDRLPSMQELMEEDFKSGGKMWRQRTVAPN